MCGIIGIISSTDGINIIPLVISGLRRLEYRGYDSAGIAAINQGVLTRRRAQGKLIELIKVIDSDPIQSNIAIGHTRWATHGRPSINNAHPHMLDNVAVVHNGIIENFSELKDELIAAGCSFASDTDTEVIVHMIANAMNEGASPHIAVYKTMQRLRGAFALAILFTEDGGLLIGARRGAPLVVASGDNQTVLGSDVLSLADLASQVAYLEEGDLAILKAGDIQIFDSDNVLVARPFLPLTTMGLSMMEKGRFPHFTLKEIYDQPQVLGDALASYLDPVSRRPLLSDGPNWLETTTLTIIGCGASYYAGQVAQYWFEQLARLPVTVELASEFRYRGRPLRPCDIALFISQSGETADTLASLRHARKQGQYIIAMVNVSTSTMAREADLVLPIHAGPEMAVSSTKAFTCQLIVLMSLVLGVSRLRGTIDKQKEDALCAMMTEIPMRIMEIFRSDNKLQEIAQILSTKRDVLYIGRGSVFPIAMEGALKLKELSYIHAEGYAAGELKHGPIALIDPNVPVIVLAPPGDLFIKTFSNMQEVIARSGLVILISDSAGISYGKQLNNYFVMPDVDQFVAPLLYTIPMQLLAYHTAVIKGTDVDQPRNLAKSVTVE